jgi:hypothetical protein
MVRLLVCVLWLAACQDEQRIVCGTVADCPGDATCTAIECAGHICKYNNYPDQSLSPLNQPGDCKQIACDGQGGFIVMVDMTDLPATSAQCELARCSADGMPSVTAAQTGTSCGSSMYCSDTGSCVECIGPLQCPGSDSACASRTCINNGCGIAYTAAGTSCGGGKHCDGAGACS